MIRGADEVDVSNGTPPDQTDFRRGSFWSRAKLWALVELFVLSGFAIAQPLLDVTGKNPDVLLVRRADRLDIVLLVLGVTLLPVPPHGGVRRPRFGGQAARL